MQLYYDFLNQIKEAISNNIHIDDICNFHYSLSALLNIFKENPSDCQDYINHIRSKLDLYKEMNVNAFSKGVSNLINYIDPNTSLEMKFIHALPKRYSRYLYHSIGSSQTFYLSELSSVIISEISRIIREKNNKNNQYIDILDNYNDIIELCNLLEFGQVYGLLCAKNNYAKVHDSIEECYNTEDYIPISIIIYYAKNINEGL